MELYRTCKLGFQNETIIEENLTTSYIIKESKRTEYLEKFREYKNAYAKKWHKAEKNPDNAEYKEDVKAFIKDMKPYNEKLKNNEISKIEYMEILNKRKNETIY